MILLLLLLFKKFIIISYREKLRDWPYETSATNELSGAKSSRRMPEDERDLNLLCVKPSFYIGKEGFFISKND